LNEVIVGSVGIRQYEHENRLPLEIKSKLSQNIVELKRMYVHKNYRRLGVAKKLLFNLEDWCKNYNYKQIILSTSSYQTESIIFYHKLGFKMIYSFTDSFWHPQFLYFLKEI